MVWDENTRPQQLFIRERPFHVFVFLLRSNLDFGSTRREYLAAQLSLSDFLDRRPVQTSCKPGLTGAVLDALRNTVFLSMTIAIAGVGRLVNMSALTFSTPSKC